MQSPFNADNGHYVKQEPRRAPAAGSGQQLLSRRAWRSSVAPIMPSSTPIAATTAACSGCDETRTSGSV